MDNANSQARIQVPQLPSNAEQQMGSTKTDLVKFILGLIAQSQITGLNEDGATDIEEENISNLISGLRTDVDALRDRAPRKLSAAGVSSAVVTIPIDPPLESNLYDVDMALVGGSGAIPTIIWSVVNGSKTTTQFQVRIQGDATAYSLDFTVTPTHNL